MIALTIERPPRVRSWLFIGGVVLLFAISFTTARAIPLPRDSGPDAAVSLIAGSDESSSAVSSAPSPATLAISAAPGGICAFAVTNCPAGTGVAQVNLSVTIQKPHGWSDVQVAFVMDTTPFMGVFDPTKGNISGESNAVPFLVHNATEIASAIQAAHPQSNVSFALVDYFSTCDHDDCDGSAFHVDVANFTANAADFGRAANASFTNVAPGFVIKDSDLADNTLHSSSITAIYGTMVTSALSWSTRSHHVVVWVGATAPRDPSYTQNYCVILSSPSLCSDSTNMSSGCEPAYDFDSAHSDKCVGWVRSSSEDSRQSLAALSHQSPNCAGSLGSQCTIDTIDVWAAPTDPSSSQWPAGQPGGGANGTVVVQNTHRVLMAGCDLANATNGTWDGPSFFACPNGVAGSLLFADKYANGSTNFNNPTLLQSLARIGFGEGGHSFPGVSGRPMFTYVPFGNMTLVPGGSYVATCTTSSGPFTGCQSAPQVLTQGGRSYLTWNWSSASSDNVLHVGDRWNASFTIEAAGGPFGTVPIDACSLTECAPDEGNLSSDAVSGVRLTVDGGVATFASFPLATIDVLGPTPLGAGPVATPASPAVNEVVYFQAGASGGEAPYAYNWSFGDGTADTNASPQHAFGRTGTFTVSLSVNDQIGGTVQATVTVTVVSSPLVVQLSSDRNATTAGHPVHLTGTAYGGVSVYSYVWGGLPLPCRSQNSTSLTCLPTSPGNYTISFSVSDSAGNHQQSQTSLLVNRPIHAKVLVTPPTGCPTGKSFVFAFATDVRGGTPGFAYHWGFGDGGVGEGATAVSHTYRNAGTYIVNVYVVDSVGAGTNGSALLHVAVPSNCPGSPVGHSTTVAPTTTPILIAAVVIVAVVVAIILIVRRSR